MLLETTSHSQKRVTLRTALKSGRTLRLPGAFSPFVALLAAAQGFDGIYISGAGLANDLALPDIGLTHLGEVSARAAAIAQSVALPSIVDIDTGFGEVMNVVRTVRTLCTQGLAGCHLEDQENPKRCGHLDNKILIETKAMCTKIRAAADAKTDPHFLIIARTDARGVEGLAGALARAQAYVDAGAEMIFAEALESEKEWEEFRKSIRVPLLANMTEFGKSQLLPYETFNNLGVEMVIYPMTAFRLAMKAIEEGFLKLKQDGYQKDDLIEKMQTRKELYALLRYEDYASLDKKNAGYFK